MKSSEFWCTIWLTDEIISEGKIKFTFVGWVDKRHSRKKKLRFQISLK